MAASYHREGLDRPAVFELFRAPPPSPPQLAAQRRDRPRLCGWSARCASTTRSSNICASLGFAEDFIEHLADFRFSGDVAAIPEGSLCFADEPLVRVTGPRIEAQLLETLLLNQINFQTMVATKAAAGRPGGRWVASPGRVSG